MMSSPDTRIYYADVSCLQDTALYDRLYAKLAPFRREKADALRFDADKQRSVGAGILLQKALSKAGFCAQMQPPQFGENEKPYFAGLPDFHFNLSHSGKWVLCAVSAYEVGCDIEEIGNCNEALAKRFFHPQEYAAILACPTQAEKIALFYRLWVLKESYLKATGKGLTAGLDTFCITLTDHTASLQAAVPCSLFEFSVDPAYRAACCLLSDTQTVPQLIEIDLAKDETDKKRRS